MEENQVLNEEKYYIMKSCIQNQSAINSNPNSFIQSYDGVSMHNALYNQNEKENIGNMMFESKNYNLNRTQKVPLTSRINADNHMSVDQSSIMGPSIRISQNFGNRNMSSLSNRVSCDVFSNDLLKASHNMSKNTDTSQITSKPFSKNRDYSSTTSISFYKPQNPIKSIDNNRSSVSIKTANYSNINDRYNSGNIEAARNQLIKSKSSKHTRRNAQHRDVRSARRSLVANYKPVTIHKPTFGVNSSQNSDMNSYIDNRLKHKK